MTLSREPSEPEYLVSLVAGQVAAAQVGGGSSLDIRMAVGTAERIIEEIISRADNPEYPAELDPGIVFIDEFSSQRNDGGDKQAGISVGWRRGDEHGPYTATLTPHQVNELMGVIVTAVEEWAEQYGTSFTVLYDREPEDAD